MIMLGEAVVELGLSHTQHDAGYVTGLLLVRESRLVIANGLLLNACLRVRVFEGSTGGL
jgi:hypothetical protein